MTTERPTRDRGVGDTIERAIKAVSRGAVKPCSKCEERRNKLNRLMPYKNRETDA